MSTVRKASPISSTLSTLRFGFWHFFLLQLPEASSDLLEKVFPSSSGEGQLFWRVLILFPYFCIASTAASSLTFASVLSRLKGEPLSLRQTFRMVFEKASVLVPVSLLLGMVTLLGFIALVLPGVYFMALFLFVPQLIVAEPRLPWSVYLHKSKRLAKGALWKTLAVVTVFFLLNIFVYAGTDTIEGKVAGSAQTLSLTWLLSLFLTLSLSMIIGAIVNVWVAYYFLELRERGAT